MLTFTVSRYYSVVTPESAEVGDTAETGEVYRNEEMDLRSVVRELQECCETSVWPASPEYLDAHCWAETDTIQDRRHWEKGEDRRETVHVSQLNGRDISGRNLYRLWKLAGLVR